jgi:Peptidase propeptide and YPEB domain
MLARREFMFALLLAGGLLSAGNSWAKDGGSDSSGSDSSGSDNSGSDNSGSDNSGSDNSGSDSSGSDDGGGDSNNSGPGSQNSGKYRDQYQARDAVKSGNALPLEEALKKLRARYPGKVISVNLGELGPRLCYWFKVKSDDGNVRKIVMDAKTGKIRGLLGFGGF